MLTCGAAPHGSIATPCARPLHERSRGPPRQWAGRSRARAPSRCASCDSSTPAALHGLPRFWGDSGAAPDGPQGRRQTPPALRTQQPRPAQRPRSVPNESARGRVPAAGPGPRLGNKDHAPNSEPVEGTTAIIVFLLAFFPEKKMGNFFFGEKSRGKRRPKCRHRCL